ncbi:hypothetical protein OC846_005723 [Tilletia horrida]|uniref:CENP-V/GFA domain-containing protein n=1 Tax=Tilletia horrida TaxID=155126 RepID=A0AAN6GJZ0_9BASI|nr:hypothetical protein OC846_005723 [Tilletia horrida]KAK0561270.1 hypothetical protein OC861_005892 [Tilletia horrida]
MNAGSSSTPLVHESGEDPIKPLSGSCFCKALQYDLHPINRSDLTLSAYCHCSKCQILNGAPYVWTTHWTDRSVSWREGHELTASAAAAQHQEQGDDLLPNRPASDLPRSMQTFCTIPNRKYKIRCRECGTPMGSWNEAKREWTLWPTSLDRPTAENSTDVGSVLQVATWFAPDHHQFWGPWRAVELKGDGLPRYAGYAANSERID